MKYIIKRSSDWGEVPVSVPMDLGDAMQRISIYRKLSPEYRYSLQGKIID